METLNTIALVGGSAVGSGINLYATVLMLGLLQRFGFTELPPGLAILQNEWVLGVAGLLYLVEFVADKVPYVDSVWDVVHTFIRVPAGAVVSYAATNEMHEAVSVVALLLGGGLALGAHGTKASARMLANISPEPVSNWTLSIVEDIFVVVAMVAAVLAPIILFLLLLVFFGVAVFLGPRVVRAIRKLLKGFAALITGKGWKTAAKVAD